MKSKKMFKKLNLSKVTVATLDDNKMNVSGGVRITQLNTCDTCNETCTVPTAEASVCVAYTCPCNTERSLCTYELSECINHTCGTQCQ